MVQCQLATLQMLSWAESFGHSTALQAEAYIPANIFNGEVQPAVCLLHAS